MATLGPPPRARQGPPNVVVLMTDDQTVEDMAAMPRTRAAARRARA